MSEFLTVEELQKISRAMPRHTDPRAPIKIVVEEDRIMVKNIKTESLIVWVNRTLRPFWKQQPVHAS